MAKACQIYPTIRVNGTDVPSRLFRDLLRYTGSHERAKQLWSMSQVKAIMEGFENLEYDENGEVTLESFRKAAHLDEILGKENTVEDVEKELDARDKDGNLKTHKDVKESIEKAIDANKKNKEVVVDVDVTTDGAKMIVNKLSSENADTPGRVVFGNELNNKLLGIMRYLGFDVSYMQSERFNAMFSPHRAQTNADGLKTVIQIVKGQKGEEAFPEEFAHLMIEGLQQNELVQRLMRSLQDLDTIQSVLGDEYQKYVDLYNGDINLLRKEAAGKLLGQYIKGEASEIDRTSILGRIWNFIKDMISDTKEGQIDNAINEANKIASEVANKVLSGSLNKEVNSDAIRLSNELYAVSEKVGGAKGLLEQSIETASRRMKLLADRTKEKEYDEDLKDQIKALQKFLKRKVYAKGCTAFLDDTLHEAKELSETLKRYSSSAMLEPEEIKDHAQFLRQAKEFIDGYTPIISTYMDIEAMKENGEVKMSDEDIEQIAELANEVNKILKHMSRAYEQQRYNTVFAFLKEYWGEDKILNMGKDKGETLTLKMVLKSASRDIGTIDRYVSSLSDASDPLLSLIDRVVKETQTDRDEEIQKIMAEVRAAHEKLMKSGSNTDFIYERDSDGKLTGYIISNIDFARYKKERKEFIESLKKDPHNTYMDIKKRLEMWEQRHTDEIEYDTGKVERIPRPDVYKKDGLSKLTKAQREYYDTMLKLKMVMDSYLPNRASKLYKAPQIRNNVTEAVAENISDPKKALKILKGNLMDSFIIRNDDTEFGSDPDKGNVTLDFAGNPIRHLPVSYTQDIEDLDRLSTDFTSSMMAYAGMAVNYAEMNEIIDALELTRDLVNEREVQQVKGKNPLIEIIKVLGKIFNKAYTISGNKTAIMERLDDYFDSVVYGKRKNDGGVVTIGENDISTAKIADAIKNYSGVVGLGLNLFAGISNVVQGKLQMFFEGVSSEYFGIKDLMVSKKNYWKELPGVLGELNSVNKHNKLGLLIDKYNALEEFYNNLRDTDYYKSPVSRIVGKANWFILNNLGEHYLHSRNMLAILSNIKVKDASGKEISMYDAWEVKTNENNVSTLVLKSGITDLNGNPLSSEPGSGYDNYRRMLTEQRLKISKINQSMNGAFNEDDKGAIHRHALGRMAMQFRQWMPAHYSRRFAGKYYDAALEKQREGFYRTFGRFIVDTMGDLKRGKVSLASNWENLDMSERANIKRALTELGTFLSLMILVGLCGSEKDKKHWSSKMAIYQLKRAKMETGASIPWFSFFDNGFQILKSPAASINTIDNILDVLKVHNMAVEIKTGRYKGWSQWEKDFSQALPAYGQVRRVFDIKSENYMFQVLNN